VLLSGEGAASDKNGLRFSPLKYGNGPKLAEAWWPRHWEVNVWNVME
jgi:hypothetical protein